MTSDAARVDGRLADLLPPGAVLPDYGGAWLGGILPALRMALATAASGSPPEPVPGARRPRGAGQVRPFVRGGLPLPPAAHGATQAVLLALDGLGARMVERAGAELPVIASLPGGTVTSCAPSTTVAALTCLTTGRPPAVHGLVGYRFRLAGRIFAPLSWRYAGPGRSDGGEPGPVPEELQPLAPFAGEAVPVATRAGFRDSGFTRAHLRGGAFLGWDDTDGLIRAVSGAVADGAPLVYAYDDRVDKSAHADGLDAASHHTALRQVDDLVARLLDALPPRCVLIVTADHGHIPVRPGRLHDLDALAPHLAHAGGEARFRSLHAAAGATRALRDTARRVYGDRAVVLTRDEVFATGLLGPQAPSLSVRGRVGDVVLIGRQDHGFVAPDHPQEGELASMHGGLSADEMLVPLRGARGRGA